MTVGHGFRQVAVDVPACGPGLRVNIGVGDRHFVDDGIGVLRYEFLGHMQRFRLEVAGGIEPGSGVLIGRIHDKSVALPMAHRVSLEKFDLGVDMRAAVCGNNSDGVHELGELDEIAGSLDDLHPELIRFAVRNARLVAVQFGFIRHVIVQNVLLFGSGFGLIRYLAVGRVNNAVSAAAKSAASAPSYRRFNIRNGWRIPEALHVRMAIREPGYRPCRWRRSASSAASPGSACSPSALLRCGGWRGRCILRGKRRDERSGRSCHKSQS